MALHQDWTNRLADSAEMWKVGDDLATSAQREGTLEDRIQKAAEAQSVETPFATGPAGANHKSGRADLTTYAAELQSRLEGRMQGAAKDESAELASTKPMMALPRAHRSAPLLFPSQSFQPERRPAPSNSWSWVPSRYRSPPIASSVRVADVNAMVNAGRTPIKASFHQHRPAPRAPVVLSRSMSTPGELLGGGVAPEDVLQSELSGTLQVLSSAKEQLAADRRESQREAMRREREYHRAAVVAREQASSTARAAQARAGAAAKAAAKAASVGLGAASAKRGHLLSLAEQVARQRKALEVELKSEQMRRQDRQLGEDQWAERAKELMDQLEQAERAASQYQYEGEQMEARYVQLKQAWVESVRQAQHRRTRRAALTDAFDSWVEANESERVLERLTSRLSGSLSVQHRSTRAKLRGFFERWFVKAAEVKAEAEAAAMSEREIKQLQRLTELSAEVGALEARLAEAAGAAAASEEAAKHLEARCHAAEQKARDLLVSTQQEKVEAITRTAARRIHHAAVARGWASWLEVWRVATHDAYVRRMHREAANTLRMPELAAGLGRWKERWSLRAEIVRARQRLVAEKHGRSVQEQLEREVELRQAAEAKVDDLKAQLAESEQAVALARTAAKEQEQTVRAARLELVDARRAERSAHEGSKGRALALERETAALERAERLAAELEQTRVRASEAATAQQVAAQGELKKHLGEQKARHSDQMAFATAEFNERIALLEAELRILRSTPPAPPPPPPQPPLQRKVTIPSLPFGNNSAARASMKSRAEAEGFSPPSRRRQQGVLRTLTAGQPLITPGRQPLISPGLSSGGGRGGGAFGPPKRDSREESSPGGGGRGGGDGGGGGGGGGVGRGGSGGSGGGLVDVRQRSVSPTHKQSSSSLIANA